MKQHTRIAAIASCCPKILITNERIAALHHVDQDWIVERTGVLQRHYSHGAEFTSHLCIKAAQKLRNSLNVKLDDVDFIIVATVTPDQAMPNVASQVQAALGIRNTGAIDVNAACAGFGYALSIGHGLISSGEYKKILVFGADTLSKVTDYADKGSSALFGDGAGVVLLTAGKRKAVFGCISGSEGNMGHELYMTHRTQPVNGLPVFPDSRIHQNGRTVFKWAVLRIAEAMQVLAKKCGLSPDDIDWFVPHSANLRIIEAISELSGFPMEKILHSITDCGNTSSASIPLALHKGIVEEKVKEGDRIMVIGFGGGLVYSGMVFEYGLER